MVAIGHCYPKRQVRSVIPKAVSRRRRFWPRLLLLLLFTFFSLGAEEVEQEWECLPHTKSGAESRHRGRMQRMSPTTLRALAGIGTLCPDIVPPVDYLSSHLAAVCGAPAQLEPHWRMLLAFGSTLTRGPPPVVKIH